MQIIDLLMSLVIALVCGAFGYIFSASKQKGKLSELETRLQQAENAYSAVTQQKDVLESDIKRALADTHNLQLKDERSQAQLHALNEKNETLSLEIERKKEALTASALRVEAIQKQYHESVTALERALIEPEALQKQADELKQQLAEEKQLAIKLNEQLIDAQKQNSLTYAENVKLQENLKGQEEIFSNQLTDLKSRLNQAHDDNNELHIERNALKDSLANELAQLKAIEASEREVREQLVDAKKKLTEQSENISSLQDKYHQLNAEYVKTKADLESREQHFQEKLAQLNDAKTLLAQEFENLANRIFEEKGKHFVSSTQVSLDGLLKPFREQIEGFQKRVNEVHDASLQNNTMICSELKKVLDIGLQMSKDATNLTSALKGDSQQLGAWGEAQLRRTLEIGGLIESDHYEEQSSFKDLEGKNKQTDFLIKLPDNKHIIIDSKVSLLAYERAISATTDAEYNAAINEHIKSVRKHVDDLSGKDYSNLVGVHSPSFVLMFMPIEPAYIAALKHDKGLFEYGYRRNVVIVSHTTLIPILRTVSNLWMIERSNSEAREISERAGEIYNNVCVVAERLGKLGGTLGTASNQYNETVRALVGKQGLYGKVDRFSRLSAKVSKVLPALEPTHADFEVERIGLIVEAVPQ